MLEVVILITVPALTQNEFGALLPLVSPEKQERIRRFRFFRDVQNSLLGDILVRSEICRISGLSNNRLEFSTNEYGKPFLINAPQIHHSISHAGHYVACAIADTPVGIDIELIRPVDLKIAERFFSPDETEYILSSDSQSLHRFFEIWTKKESRIKLEGKGLSKSLRSFSVFDGVDRESLTYHKVFQNDEATCHVCSDKRENPSIRIIDTRVLMENIKQVFPLDLTGAGGHS